MSTDITAENLLKAGASSERDLRTTATSVDENLTSSGSSSVTERPPKVTSEVIPELTSSLAREAPTITLESIDTPSVVNYSSAKRYEQRRPGSDAVPPLAILTNFASNLHSVDDNMSNHLVLTEEELCAPFVAIMDSYNNLLTYFSTGRAAMIDEVSENETVGNDVADSYNFLAPASRASLDMVLSTFCAKIDEMKARVAFFDNDINKTKDNIVCELMLALHTIPAADLCPLVQGFCWPTEAVCHDLNLRYDYVLMARGEYNSRTRATNAKSRQSGDAYEDIPRAAVLVETKPVVKKINISERRKRMRFDSFFQGNEEEAQIWMQRYEFLCRYDRFDEEKVDELEKFGGGVDPALIALKELKKLHQENRSMRVFGPIITNFISRAQVFAPGVVVFEQYMHHICGNILALRRLK
ncbi:uncharacterized protein EV154DRAFT_604363 [Mucor mucedo]|uniref:uncharacterized protein n=1 Tax=Mucor mucedo TaxID=29922 RepID=UPI002220124E|nr:uncharacterized protein EV154DRAFT_604363 [Mucor mucedo]KAI7889010.1 hypothetical protein EV154DRAFT_604363 [Mucor mucedo]